MAVRGTIVRSNNGSHPYQARDTAGRSYGNFVSVRAAQIVIEQTANRRLRWVSEQRDTSTEAYRGEDV